MTRPYRSDLTVEEFVRRHGTPYDPATDKYHREPFARETKVGKTSAIYNAHSYHTKVPAEGIVPYLLHYTNPGELVLDPFCGTGMTGVAAMLCAQPHGVEAPPGSRLGARAAILNDLSPAACHIAYNYTHPLDVRALKAEFEKIMGSLQGEFDRLYGTTCDGCGGPATIQYTIWSDVFECFRCGGKIVLWDVAVNPETGEVKDDLKCPNCGVEAKKTRHRRVGAIPVVTNYECGAGCRPKRRDHRVSESEARQIQEIEGEPIPYWYPTDPIGPEREMFIRSALHLRGVTTFADFFTKRNLRALAAVWDRVRSVSDERVRFACEFWLTGVTQIASRMSTFRFDSRNPENTAGGIHKNTLYIPSLSKEGAVPGLFRNKWPYLSKCFPERPGDIHLSTGSADSIDAPAECVDYIFTDPPFGSNIFYSDCSFLWESWLQDFTDRTREAVWNKSLKPEAGGKTLDDYAGIMAGAFREMHRVLKPGRWASVVFSNSDDKVWQAIRDAAADAGFTLENTVALDKTQRSFKQVKGEKGEEDVVGTDIVMNLRKRSRASVAVSTVPDLEDRVLTILRERLADLNTRPGAASDAQRSTSELYSHVLRALMEAGLSNRGLTMPFVEDLCATVFKKVAGCWHLASDEIRYEAGLSFEVVDERSAIDFLRSKLSVRSMSFGELVQEWRAATLKVGHALGKDLHQVLEENFWHEADTNRWRIPTTDERARMGDERTVRLRRRLRRVIDGEAATAPDLLELMIFAWQDLADARSAVAVFGRLDLSVLSEDDAKRARRLYQVARARAAEDEENEAPDGRLL